MIILLLIPVGRWTIGHAEDIKTAAETLALDGARSASIDLSGLDAIDTAGALVLFTAVKRLRDAGVETEIGGAPEDFADLLQRVAEAKQHQPPPPAHVGRIGASLERIGRHTVAVAFEARDLLSFFGLTIIATGRILVCSRSL